MKKAWVVVLLVVFVLLLAPTGCGSQSADESDKVYVGEIWSLTGEFSIAGVPGHNAAMLAVKKVNDSGGVLGKQVELVTVDGKGSQSDTISAMNKLASDERVVAIFGLEGGKYVTAAAPVAQKGTVSYLVSIGTQPQSTEPGEWIFMTAITDDVQGDLLAKYSVQKLGKKTACVMTDVADPYSSTLSKYFIDGFKNYTSDAKSILSQENYQSGDVDFGAQLTRIRDLKPDVLAILANPAEAPLIAKQARELGIQVQFVGGDGVDSVDLTGLGGDAVEGMIFATHYFAGNPINDLGEQFNTDFKTAYGSDPTGWEALGYDSALLVVDAIKRAGKLDREAVRAALTATNGFEGVTGTYSFDSRRIPKKPLVFVQIKGGQRTFLETIQP